MSQRCPRCQQSAPADAAYCPRCGGPIPAPGSVPPPPATATGAAREPLTPGGVPGHAPAGSADARNWAVGAHLSALITLVTGLPSFLGPLVVWLLKRDDDAFVETHAREALNFNLSVLVYVVVGIAGLIATLGLAALVLLPVALAAFVGWLVVVIIAAGRAANGQPYRYPLTIRFLG